MVDEEVVRILYEIKRRRGFRSLNDVIRWLIDSERKLRRIIALDRLWSMAVDEENLGKMLGVRRKLREDAEWLRRGS